MSHSLEKGFQDLSDNVTGRENPASLESVFGEGRRPTTQQEKALRYFSSNLSLKQSPPANRQTFGMSSDDSGARTIKCVAGLFQADYRLQQNNLHPLMTLASPIQHALG